MVSIAPEKRSVLAELFAGHRRQRLLIDAALEGHYGIAMADSEQEPRAGQLSVAHFTMCAGDPKPPAASELIRALPGTNFVPETDAWRDLMVEIHGIRVNKHLRTDFSNENLNMDHLRELQERVPEGFEVRRIDRDSVRQLGYDMDRDSLYPMRMRSLIEHGIGFWAIQDNRWVSLAYSYVICERGIEIEIETRHDCRRRGLATCVGAALILHCLEREMEPHWSAANAMSVGLAEKLGYVRCDSYECMWPEFRHIRDLDMVGYRESNGMRSSSSNQD